MCLFIIYCKYFYIRYIEKEVKTLNNNFPNNSNNNCGCKTDQEIMQLINQNRRFNMVIVGPTGPTGPTGPIGDTPVLTIGTVTTGDPGTEASATITGTAPNFVLNLTIPQGPTGPAPVN